MLKDSITLGAAGQGFTTKGVKIPVGQSKTIEIDLFSDAKTAPWSVAVREPTRGGAPQPATLAFSLDRAQGVNGEKLHLTITSLKASQYKASAFVVVSALGDQKAYWAGLVSMQ